MTPRRAPSILAALLLTACAALPGADPSISDADVREAAATVQLALETRSDNETVAWDNGATGAAGSVTPVRTYVSTGGYFCRQYREEIFVGGRTGDFHNTACRSETGRWVWI
jgi:surface antigen